MTRSTKIGFNFQTDTAPMLSGERVIVSDGVLERDYAVAGNATNVGYNLASLAAGRKAYLFLADGELTINFNGDSAPSPITLVAGVPVVWDGTGTAGITQDITTIYATNPGADTVNLKIRIPEDNVAVG